jgi:hypothetical protein
MKQADERRKKNAPAEPSSRPKPVYNSAGAACTLGGRTHAGKGAGTEFFALIEKNFAVFDQTQWTPFEGTCWLPRGRSCGRMPGYPPLGSGQVELGSETP